MPVGNPRIDIKRIAGEERHRDISVEKELDSTVRGFRRKQSPSKFALRLRSMNDGTVVGDLRSGEGNALTVGGQHRKGAARRDHDGAASLHRPDKRSAGTWRNSFVRREQRAIEIDGQ